MKATSEVTTEGRGPGRWAVLGMLALVLPLPSCTVNTSGIVLDRHRWNCSATIQSDSDGVVSVVSTDNLMDFAGSEALVIAAPADRPESARYHWLRYLRRILEARAGDEAFRAVHGAGPWCVIDEPGLMATEQLVAWGAPGVADEMGPELELCSSCNETCGNSPGVVPHLAVSPTDPAMPYRVDFGSSPVGSPVVREVRLTNSGEGRLCLNPPAVHATSLHPDDFALGSFSGCEVTSEGVVVLQDGEVCQFTATFTPGQAGARSALVPAARGCGGHIVLSGTGSGGLLSASPAPACFPPLEPDPCREMSIRIDNMSPAAITLTSTSINDATPEGWSLAALQTSAGAPIDPTAPHLLAPGQFVTARVRACAIATAVNRLRVFHNGMDYGAPGSPTGDLDPGSPLVIELQPPGTDCTP